MANNAKNTFQEIIALTEKTSKLMDDFTEFDKSEQEAVLVSAFAEQTKDIDPDADVPITLVRTAEMLVGVMTEKSAGALCSGLSSENATVRMLCGDAIMHVAEDDLNLLKPSIDQILKKGGTAAEELPFVLLEVDDPEVPRIIEKFLKSQEPEVVASAIEALIEIGDMQSEKELKALVNDKRVVSLDESLEDETTTIGELAKDALELLAAEDQE